MAKIEPVLYGDRKVYTVSAFNRGVARFLGRLPVLWVEGEVQELRRNVAWANVFLTLKDPQTGATLKVTIARTAFDRLELGLAEGETVHVSGRAELYELKGSSACGQASSSESVSAVTSWHSSASNGSSPPKGSSRRNVSGASLECHARSASSRARIPLRAAT